MKKKQGFNLQDGNINRIEKHKALIMNRYEESKSRVYRIHFQIVNELFLCPRNHIEKVCAILQWKRRSFVNNYELKEEATKSNVNLRSCEDRKSTWKMVNEK